MSCPLTEDRLQVCIRWKTARELPPEFEPLLGCSERGVQECHYYDGAFHDNDGDALSVTHWAEMPTPPEVVRC